MSDELNNIKGGNKTCELMNWSLIILDNGIKNTFKVTIFYSSKLQGDRDLERNHKLTGTHWAEFTIQAACSRAI